MPYTNVSVKYMDALGKTAPIVRVTVVQISFQMT